MKQEMKAKIKTKVKKTSPTINHKNSLLSIIKSSNFVIFITLVVGGLIAAVFVLTNILNSPYQSTNTQTNSTGQIIFDQTAINQMTNFQTSTNNSSYKTLPSGRNNPFSE